MCFYPAWFAGTWSVDSVSRKCWAPCGVVLFGGNRTFDKAQKEIAGTSLLYESRFVAANSASRRTGDYCTLVIWSRQIPSTISPLPEAAVRFGANGVVDVNGDTASFVCLSWHQRDHIASPGGPLLHSVVDETFRFRHCGEVVREIVAPLDNKRRVPQLQCTIPF
jgi:hypothetical protein